jgi:hypothetical protein
MSAMVATAERRHCTGHDKAVAVKRRG